MILPQLELLPDSGSLDPVVELQVQAIWDKEKAVTGSVRNLFDGPIYSLLDASGNTVTFVRRNYRHLVAARHDPELARQLALRPIGVTGFLFCQDGLVLGKRHPSSAFEAGKWEAVPSGTLDDPSPEVCLFRELKEELGIERDDIMSFQFSGLLDCNTTSVEFIFVLYTARSFDAILACHQEMGSQEHSALIKVPIGELGSQIECRYDMVSDFSAALSLVIANVLTHNDVLPRV